jgi:hypothetical protein
MRKQKFIVVTATNGDYNSYPQVILAEHLADEQRKAEFYGGGEFTVQVICEFELDVFE